MNREELIKMVKALRSTPAVAGLKEWNGRRIYVQIAGASCQFNGDTSYAAYIDASDASLVLTNGKGTCSRAFVDGLRAVVAAYPGKVRKEAFGPADEGFSFIA